MRYDLDNFQVTPGAKVKLTLKNNDDMPHNLVLCRPIRPDVGAEVARKAWDLGGEGIAKHPHQIGTTIEFCVAVRLVAGTGAPGCHDPAAGGDAVKR